LAQEQTVYQALYRKWRPQKFSEVVGQSFTVQTLKNAIIQGEISHAYLFSGPRGIGKTSVARILAKAINCPNQQDGEPCNECPGCERITRGSAMDVIEIDGASNRGIDQIRQLREEVNFAPAESRYKVYIIDEVHMLTNEAFNALLKTLEEPPSHVVFVFATTEPHKVPPTVLSRCQAFEFKTIPQEQIEDHLVKVAQAEGIEADGEALSAIARHARGALRDALVLLEQLVSYKGRAQISAQDLYEVLGLPPEETLDAFLRALIARDGPKALSIIADLAERGRDFELFLEELLHRSRDFLIAKLSGQDDEQPDSAEDWVSLTGWLLEIKREMRYAFDKRIFLEVEALEIAQASASPKEPPPPPAPKGETAQAEGKADPKPKQPAPPQPRKKSRPKSGKGDRWGELLERVKKEKIALHALLAEAAAREEEDELIIEYPPDYGFHKERLEQPENLNLLRVLVKEIYGEVRLTIGFQQASAEGSEPETKTKTEAAREKAELVRRIFEGKILR